MNGVLFLKGGHVCSCVTQAIMETAAAMYRESTPGEQRFGCLHGDGVVKTEFAVKMVGDMSGIFFEAEVEVEGQPSTIRLSFIARPNDLLSATKWAFEFGHGPARDLPHEAFN